MRAVSNIDRSRNDFYKGGKKLKSIISAIKNLIKKNDSEIKIYQDKHDSRITRIEIRDSPDIGHAYHKVKDYLDRKDLLQTQKAVEWAAMVIHQELVQRDLARDNGISFITTVNKFLHVHAGDPSPLIEAIAESKALDHPESDLFHAVEIYFAFQENLKQESEHFMTFKKGFLDKLMTLC